MNKIRIFHKINYDNAYERHIEYEDYIIEYNTNTLLTDVVKDVKHSQLNIRDYYDLSLRAHLYNCDVPYIYQDGSLAWNVRINEVKVIDVIKTHEIDDTIMVESYIASHGGYYHLMDLVELWESIVPVLLEISKYLGVLFVFEKAINKISKLFIKKKVSPMNVIELILTREIWNQHELAKLLELEIEQTKCLLKALGYKWDKQKLAYRNGNIKFVHNKFSQMSVITKKEFKG